MKFKKVFRIFSHRNYRLYFSGQIISFIGMWIQFVAMSWLTYNLTDSAFMLGFVGFLSRLPTFILSPFAGVFVDHWNKYRLLMVTQVVSLLLSVILALLVFLDSIQVWHILALGIVGGIVGAFDMPTRQAFIVDIIPKREDLSDAIVANSLLGNLSRLVGPSLAGLLLAKIGEGWCFTINAIAFLPPIICLILMDIPNKRAKRRQAKHWKEFKDGFFYAINSTSILTLLLLLALVSLMGMPYQVLMPAFAKDILGGDADTLGFLTASVSIGGIAGALYLASRTSTRGLERVVAASTCIFGIGLIIFSVSTSFWLSLFTLVFTGFGMMTQMTACNTILQVLCDDDKRGRVMSFYTMAFMGTIPFGNLLAGCMAKAFGSEWAVFVGGISCIVGVIFFILKIPAIRKEGHKIQVQRAIQVPDM